MPRKTNTRIMKKHLIICEGRDEQEFLISYLNSAALADVPDFAEEIQVLDFGGISDLSVYLQVLQNTENFETVESLLIIRDAEEDAAKAVREIQSALRRNHFSIPETPHLWKGESPKIGFLLFPTCDTVSENGTLEDMCLSVLSGSQASHLVKEINGFMMQLENNYQLRFTHPHKTRLHTYFSIRNQYVSLKIGEAAKAGAFDWYHVLLEPFKNFLLEVINP